MDCNKIFSNFVTGFFCYFKMPSVVCCLILSSLQVLVIVFLIARVWCLPHFNNYLMLMILWSQTTVTAVRSFRNMLKICMHISIIISMCTLIWFTSAENFSILLFEYWLYCVFELLNSVVISVIQFQEHLSFKTPIHISKLFVNYTSLLTLYDENYASATNKITLSRLVHYR